MYIRLCVVVFDLTSGEIVVVFGSAPHIFMAPSPAVVELSEENCAICLEPVQDRCVLPKCFHSCFCFSCILEWIRTQQGTKHCPLCKLPLGSHILHSLDATDNDALKHVISKDSDSISQTVLMRLSDDDAINTPELPNASSHMISEHAHPSLDDIRLRDEGRFRQKQRAALAFRRHVYRHNLYAKHVASNRHTRYRPYPGPSGFRQNPVYARLLSTFLQRELHVWPHVDIAFLSYYIPALLSQMDVTSNTFVQRLTEWIGNANDARLLAHEMELFVRSGRGGLGLDQYDKNPWLQYDNV